MNQPTADQKTSQEAKKWSRRSFTVAAAGFPIVASIIIGDETPTDALLPSPAAVESPGLASQGAAAYHFMIDSIRVTALSNGTVPLDLHRLSIGSTAARTDALLQNSFLANPSRSRSMSGSSRSMGDRSC